MRRSVPGATRTYLASFKGRSVRVRVVRSMPSLPAKSLIGVLPRWSKAASSVNWVVVIPTGCSAPS